MGSEAKSNGSSGGGGFRSKIDNFLYSGDKKHVLAGIAIISVAFGVPWYLMSRGTKHQSHQDYLERADKARSERLSSSSAR
ncbi:hypothetical protein P3X46_010754 [Hevea brasiliensis]|uniref:GAG1At protein n=1 Tax=Hevea brasiliensis TaxID=3981 RepID=A0ABQ9MG76_HEVBR|nr:uncharacterized protein LOC110672667 [Hevea brasiliensis]KAJ9178908.1 hypothetical protein P3X46_010754 [Hevea brasiliensis]